MPDKAQRRFARLLRVRTLQLGQVRAQLSDPNWAVPEGATTGYVFAALVFWVFCFGMSRYSVFMERRLNTGHRN